MSEQAERPAEDRAITLLALKFLANARIVDMIYDPIVDVSTKSGCQAIKDRAQEEVERREREGNNVG